MPINNAYVVSISPGRLVTTGLCSKVREKVAPSNCLPISRKTADASSACPEFHNLVAHAILAIKLSGWEFKKFCASSKRSFAFDGSRLELESATCGKPSED